MRVVIPENVISIDMYQADADGIRCDLALLIRDLEARGLLRVEDPSKG